MIPLRSIPGAPNDPAQALAVRCREFAELAEAIKSRLRDMQSLNESVTWAVVGSVSHCVEELEGIASFIGVPGVPAPR